MFQYIFLAFSLFVAAVNTQDTFDAEKSHPLLQSLKQYQIVKPLQFTDNDFKTKKNNISTLLDEDTKSHQKRTFFTIELNGTNHMIELSLNDFLFSPSFGQTFDTLTDDVTGKETKNDVTNHCYYQGFVKGVEGSYVTASTCNGGLSATVFLPQNTFIVKPLTTDDDQHVIYKHHDYVETQRPVTCRNNGIHKVENPERDIHKIRNKRAIDRERKMYLELMLVVDKAEADKYKSRLELSETMKKIVNHAAGLYRKLGINLVFSHLEVWDVRDQIPKSRDSLRVLNEFQRYRARNIKRRVDSVHLIYGGNFNGNTVGHANSQTICTNGGVGVTMGGGPFRSTRVATTLAHEIGHNLGMGHDTRGCRCPNRNCIMDAVTSGRSPAKDWSSCSELELDRTLDLGYANCLFNVPNTENTYGGIQCGNKIVEKGEECDCGSPKECRSTCCNARTCKLVAGAKCDSGLCCSRCQYQTPGTECRKRAGPCDLPEQCTGMSATCPNDFHVQNGLSCNEGKNLCYGGNCIMSDNTCSSIWGAGAVSGPDICFSLINRRGDQRGNCGWDGKRFIPCTRGNEECGKLHCVGGRDTPIISATYASTGFRLGRTVTDCKYLWSDPRTPNLVRNGTKCGTNRACNNGECLPIPKTTCSCNKNGICNNEGNCHCNKGWAPPNCDTPGRGGSINSGYVEIRLKVAPKELAAFEVTTKSVTFKWLPTLGAVGYTVSLSQSGVTVESKTVIDQTNVTFTDLIRATFYTARVQAINGERKSPSARLRVRTLNAEAPTRVKALAISPTSVRISWKKLATSDWFNVQIIDKSDDSVVSNMNRIKDSYVEIKDLTSSKTYEVQVTVTERRNNSLNRIVSYTSLPRSVTVYLRCQLRPIDFLFVYDISSVTGAKNLNKVKDFMVDFLQLFPALNISNPEATRVAAVKYSGRAGTIFNYDRTVKYERELAQIVRYWSELAKTAKYTRELPRTVNYKRALGRLVKFDLTPNVVGALRYLRYGGGPSYAGRMVDFVYSSFFGSAKSTPATKPRPGALQITIILSGGRSSDSIVSSSARRLQEATNVFAVGIKGKSVSKNLALIASRPEFIFTAQSYDELDNLKIDMQKKMCQISA